VLKLIPIILFPPRYLYHKVPRLVHYPATLPVTIFIQFLGVAVFTGGRGVLL
jgi:hypothetical protein